MIKTITGNKAKLVNSEICQRCAQCCKEFIMTTDINCALRLAWTDNRKIKAKDTPFKWTDGIDQKEVMFKFPCIQLECKDRKYRCKQYGQERPDFCATYPDHIFYNVESWNTQKIEKLLEESRKECPGLKDVTVQDVVKMLEER